MDREDFGAGLGCLLAVVLFGLIFGGLGVMIDGLDTRGDYALSPDERADIKQAGETLGLDKSVVADRASSRYRKPRNDGQVFLGILMMLAGGGVIAALFIHEHRSTAEARKAIAARDDAEGVRSSTKLG